MTWQKKYNPFISLEGRIYKLEAVQYLVCMKYNNHSTNIFFLIFFLPEVLSAMISVLLVYILMGFLLYEAVQRTIHMKYEINGDIMLITAAIGVAVNVM